MMRNHEHESLAAEADFACAVMGIGHEYMLVPLSEEDGRAKQMCEESARRGYKYAGILAMVRGQAASKCADLDSIVTLACATREFAELVAEQIRAQANFTDWATRLWSLQDTRPD